MSPSEVHIRYAYRDKSVPTLGLLENFDYDWRVYALELQHGCTYVGIAAASQVKRTIQRHFDAGNRCHYTSKHRPLRVLLVWPAISRSVEAYVYHAFLDRLSVGHMREGKLGGWIQTSSVVSPLGFLLQREASRMMHSQCLNCGSKDHFASQCEQGPSAATYPCVCGKEVCVTARGQTVSKKSATSSSSSSSSSSSGAAPAAPAAAAPAPPRRSQQQTLKRSAAAAALPDGGPATLTFASIWNHPSKFRKKDEFGSLADLLTLMNTGAANRAKGRPGEKVGVWKRRWGWRQHTDYKTGVKEFGSRPGGGSSGVGLSKDAAKQVYMEHNKV